MRRLLILAALLLLPNLAAAQPWAPEGQRAAGRLALAAANAQRWDEATRLATTADPLVAKIVQWLRLTTRTAPAPAAELVAFIAENPDWPFPDTLARRAEAALTVEDGDAIGHFGRAPARTLQGAYRHADALERAGRAGEAREAIRRAWADAPGDMLAEDAVLARFGAMFRAEDHWARFDRLAFARDTAGAGRAAQRLDARRRAAADARLALMREDDSRLAETPTDIGWAHARARLLRQRDRDTEAAQAWIAAEHLQAGLDGDAARAVWIERQVLSRKLLRLGQPQAAYRVAAAHGQTAAGEPRFEAEFLAGFIALRRLDQASLAEQHFIAVAQGSRSAITRARSYYWQGRALEAQREQGRARTLYIAAANFPVTFYGQLAALALGEDAAQLSARVNALRSQPVPSSQAAEFASRELARAVLALADLGDTRRARIFLLRIEDLAADGTARLLAARLAGHIGRPDHAVWVARRAGADGDMLLPEGWPAPFPIRVASPEPAFINAITRQESNFDPSAVSSADARGLMQLLPSTAALVARRIGVAYRLPDLTGNPEVNIRLGAAYLEQMLDRYAGALPLAAAAYNAGPGRVDQWLGTYGDPRGDDVDMIDWIEQIPFTETRNYVQRVIENVIVYRASDQAAASRPHPLARWLRGRP